MTNLQTITISVDTSYKNGKAATAYYIKHEKFVVKDTEFLGELQDNNIAELEGMIRAILRMKLEIRQRDIKIVYITCDNKYALTHIKDSKYAEMLNQFKEVITQHIDGHSGTRSPRQYINNWCDVESRKCLNLNIDNN